MKLISCTSALSKSGLYDIDYALNPYRGCAHGCLYCYAPDVIQCKNGESWGKWIEARTNISRALKKEIQGIGKSVIGLATVTDPYQPAEERLGLTRACLEVIANSHASLMLMTKSPLAIRDIDLLKRIKDLEFCVTITTLDGGIASTFEPGAPSPQSRLELLRQAAGAGLRTSIMISPWLVSTNDQEAELLELIRLASESGCKTVTLDQLRLRPTAVRRIDAFQSNKDRTRVVPIREIVARSESADIESILASTGARNRFKEMRIETPMID